MRRKLLFYYWKERKFISLPPYEVILSDTPKSLAWWEKSICMGTKSEYSLYRVNGYELHMLQFIAFDRLDIEVSHCILICEIVRRMYHCTPSALMLVNLEIFVVRLRMKPF